MPSELFAALAAAQAEYPRVAKSKTAIVRTKAGDEYRYRYADLGDVLNAILPILTKHGLAFSQPLRQRDGKTFVVSRLLHTAGDVLESDGIQLPPDGILMAREFGSALTYARRYDGCALLGVAPDEDDDAALTKEQKAKPANQPPAGKPGTEAEKRATGSAFIAQQQRRLLFAVGRKVGLTTAELREAIGACGYEHSNEIPKAQFNAVLRFLDPDLKYHQAQ